MPNRIDLELDQMKADISVAARDVRDGKLQPRSIALMLDGLKIRLDVLWNLTRPFVDKTDTSEPKDKLSPEDDYVQEQAKWIKHHKIEKGSRVRVMEKARLGDFGWGLPWSGLMTESIREELTVHQIEGRNHGIRLSNNCSYPFFVLEVLPPLTPGEEYTQKQEQWIKDNNIETGSPVRIKRQARDFESGWNLMWNTFMTTHIGDAFTVGKIHPKDGIKLGDFWYPYFVLEVR